MNKNIKWISKAGLISLSMLLLFYPSIILAQLNELNLDEYGLPATTINKLLDNIVNFIAGIAGTICVVALIVSGIIYGFSGGSEEKIKKAKSIFLYAIIGVTIVISSWAIIKLITDILSGQPIQ